MKLGADHYIKVGIDYRNNGDTAAAYASFCRAYVAARQRDTTRLAIDALYALEIANENAIDDPRYGWNEIGSLNPFQKGIALARAALNFSNPCTKVWVYGATHPLSDTPEVQLTTTIPLITDLIVNSATGDLRNSVKKVKKHSPGLLTVYFNIDSHDINVSFIDPVQTPTHLVPIKDPEDAAHAFHYHNLPNRGQLLYLGDQLLKNGLDDIVLHLNPSKSELDDLMESYAQKDSA